MTSRSRSYIRLSAVIVFVVIVTWSVVFIMSEKQIKLERRDFKTTVLGENVYIFSPEDDPVKVQTTLDDIYRSQEANEFGNERYGIYFLPGEYDSSIQPQVGFYTQIAGLGKSPKEVRINSLQCMARWLGDPFNHNACCNFWRSVENFTIKSNTIWAVSQATDMRRMYIEGNLSLHDEYGWCSGGFLADSHIERLVDSGSQQQWLSRNCKWKLWMGENWNMVFAGMEEGCAPRETWPAKPYTSVEKTKRMREKPFLVYDEKEGFGVYIPAYREDAYGLSWDEETEASWIKRLADIDADKDCILPLACFYIAQPTDSADKINSEINKGKCLLFTPGIYTFTETLLIENPNTICLGLGLATLTNISGKPIMEIADQSGIIVAGLLFDASTKQSDYLLRVKGAGIEKEAPIALSDIYCRVGGIDTKEPCSTETCMIIDADDVVGDNFWIWRADHGSQVAWDKNQCKNGIVVNGDCVELYALMVEHFNEYQTIWNGNEGQVIMYQSEIPYDVPNQDVWMSHDGGKKGYASFYVGDSVTDFYAVGLGIYLYNRDHAVTLESAMEIPDRHGVKIENICTVMLNGNPGMLHIINNAGKSVHHSGERQILTYYENGNVK